MSRLTVRYKNFNVRKTNQPKGRGYSIKEDIGSIRFQKESGLNKITLIHPVYEKICVGSDSLALLKDATFVNGTIISEIDFLKIGNRVLALPVDCSDYKILTDPNVDKRTNKYNEGDLLDDKTVYLGHLYTVWAKKTDGAHDSATGRFSTHINIETEKHHVFLKKINDHTFLNFYKSKPLRSIIQSNTPITYWDDLPDMSIPNKAFYHYVSKTPPKEIEIVEDYPYASSTIETPGKVNYHKSEYSYIIDETTIKFNEPIMHVLRYGYGTGFGLKIDGGYYVLQEEYS